MDGYVGQIMLFGGNFAPRNWLYCAGQLLPISQYQILFSVIGTIYGGNGQVNFALPDLRGRVPSQSGTGGPLTPIGLGQYAGQENVTLTTANLPPHNHAVQCSSNTGNNDSPVGNYSADEGHSGFQLFSNTANNVMGPTANTGSGQSFSIRQPMLGMNYIICFDGLYPERP